MQIVLSVTCLGSVEEIPVVNVARYIVNCCLYRQTSYVLWC